MASNYVKMNGCFEGSKKKTGEFFLKWLKVPQKYEISFFEVSYFFFGKRMEYKEEWRLKVLVQEFYKVLQRGSKISLFIILVMCGAGIYVWFMFFSFILLSLDLMY